MQVSEWLAKAETDLKEAGIDTARLDSLVLLEDTLMKDRSWLLANQDFDISSNQRKLLKNLLTRRIGHEPIAYIRNKSEFYGREFFVNDSVLEPRPESEIMIDCLLELPNKDSNWHIADVGSGSGAIGITAAMELKSGNIDLLEIDSEALKVSKINVDKFTLSLSVIKSNLLKETNNDYDILLCNLPYIPDDFHINRAATHEPKLAIFGGKDGLDVYRSLFKQLNKSLKKPLYILIESLPSQHSLLQNIASKSGYRLVKTEDFIQVFTTTNRDIE